MRRLGIASILLLILAASLAPWALTVNVDNRIEKWLDSSGSSAQSYQRLLKDFGTDEFIIIGFGGQDPLDPASLLVQLEAHESLEALTGVTHVESIAGVYRDIFGAEDPEALRDEVMSTPFYLNLLIDEKGEHGAMLVETKVSEDSHARVALVKAVENAVAPLRDYFPELHLVGPPLLNVSLDQESNREAARSFPLAFISSIVAMLLLFRSIRATFCLVAASLLTLGLLFGFIGITGYTLNMVTAVIPSVLWMLSLACGIHVFQAYRRYSVQSADSKASVNSALKESFRPCLLSALTTAAGFLALLSATMAPVRELGLFMAIGLLLSFACSFTLLPLLILVLKPRCSAASYPIIDRLIGLTGRVGTRCAVSVLTGAIVVTGALGAGMAQIKTESNPLNFFTEDAQVTRDYQYIGEHLGGYYSLEVLIDMPDSWLNPEYWSALDNIARKLGEESGVAYVISPLSLLKKLNQWEHNQDPLAYRLPTMQNEATNLVKNAEDHVQRELKRLVSPDGKSIRFSVLVREMNSERFNNVVMLAKQLINTLPSGLNGELTGIVPRLVNAQLELVDTQVWSFGLAFIVVAMFLFAGFRHLGLTILTLPPNVLPIVASLGIMGFAGIALDAATVMMASVALGIAVDDTVHIASAYLRNCANSMTSTDAIQSALKSVGPAVVFTTIMATAGFASLMISNFLPICYFGFFSSVAMLIALLADILLLPALLVKFSRVSWHE